MILYICLNNKTKKLRSISKNRTRNYSYSNNYLIFIFIFISSLFACSTSKNTSVSRTYHNITAHYNVYFNSNEGLKSGQRKIKKHKDEDYSIILPIFKYEDKNIANLVSSDMDLAIKKCAKTIKSHSITVKPKTGKKGFSQKEKDFLLKAEYCKWIDDAYLIMGKAHFYKREFETAKQTFLLNINKYSKEPSKEDAMLWLAKTYVETDDFKNAENLLIELRKVKRWDQNYLREIDLIYASMYMKQKDFINASIKLNAVLAYKKKKKEKARLNFILAQIYQHNDQYQLAIENYKKVIKSNPNYDISFTSKIKLAEIYEKSGRDAGELEKQFKKMLGDEKNIDYQDQLYYALGKIELNQKNTEKAIEYYKLSANAKSSNKNQKVKTYYALADLYYLNNNYGLAEAYYDSTIRSIEPTYPDYEEVYPNLQSHKKLASNLNIIRTEDSLQTFAKLTEIEQNKIIDKIIQKIRDIEQKQLELAQNNQSSVYDPMDNNTNYQNNQNQGSGYYFYNPNSLSYGQTDFKKKWGDRKLEDNWRRSNKQSILDDQVMAEDSEIQAKTDTLNKEKKISNNKSREYYMQDVPTTPDKLAASNKKIENALFNSAIIYYKDFNETKKAIVQFESLLIRYPETAYRLEVLQKIQGLYASIPDYTNADKYKQMILNEFPESTYAKMLSDPNYIQKIKKEESEVEKLYQTAYNNYLNKAFIETIGYCEYGLKNHPDNDLSPNFLFLKAMAYAETGKKSDFKTSLQELVYKYPDKAVTERAKGMLEVLDSRKFEEQTFLPSNDSIHYYVLIYPKEKVDINKLKFKFISLNATEYTQDDLKIIVLNLDENSDILIVEKFSNSKLALAYYEKVITGGILKEFSQLAPVNIIISSTNYQIFLKNRNLNLYLKFFEEQYFRDE